MTNKYPCPMCGNRLAKIVWTSNDGETIAVKCPERHFMGEKKRAWFNEIVPIIKKDVVFLIDLNSDGKGCLPHRNKSLFSSRTQKRVKSLGSRDMVDLPRPQQPPILKEA